MRFYGIDPPKWHDVSSILVDNEDLLADVIRSNLNTISSLSKRLRKERELSFYGEEDYIPSDNYSKQDAEGYLTETKWLLNLLKDILA